MQMIEVTRDLPVREYVAADGVRCVEVDLLVGGERVGRAIVRVEAELSLAYLRINHEFSNLGLGIEMLQAIEAYVGIPIPSTIKWRMLAEYENDSF